MAVRIRLTRVGATKRPSYRVVAIDQRRPRDGRALEILGFYDPLTDPATVQIDADRLKAWMDKGASPSETVVKLMRQAGIGGVPALPVAAPKKRAPAKSRSKAKAASAGSAAPAAEAAAPDAPAEAAAPGAPTESSATDAPAGGEADATPGADDETKAAE